MVELLSSMQDWVQFSVPYTQDVCASNNSFKTHEIDTDRTTKIHEPIHSYIDLRFKYPPH
jgi:hypothetical protein